jgi:nitrate/nitrite transport system substrate-binding protein
LAFGLQKHFFCQQNNSRQPFRFVFWRSFPHQAVASLIAGRFGTSIALCLIGFVLRNSFAPQRKYGMTVKSQIWSSIFWTVMMVSGLLLATSSGCNSGDSIDSEIESLITETKSATSEVEKVDSSSEINPFAKYDDSAALEKEELTFGFIKLTDCAPLVIAKEKGFFEEEGLFVKLEAQANWKVLLDRVIGGELDGAHMLAGQPIAATIGIGTQADLITPFSMDLNGNGITVSNAIWKKMQENDPSLAVDKPKHPITAGSLKPIVDKMASVGDPLRMGMVFPVSTHNYELRYWLAAAGIHPGYYTRDDSRGFADAQVLLSVTPPPQMPATLEQGTIQGYCVGEPWNQKAVASGIGVPVTTNYDIWKNNPEKVFGITKAWAEEHPRTTVHIVKALIKAGKWLDEKDAEGKFLNRMEAVELLSRSEYVGADLEVIASSMTGTFTFQSTDVREMPDFNVFFAHDATYPFYSDCIWFLTQMRRWGQIPDTQPDAWYHETAKKVYRPDIYLVAAKQLIQDGLLEADQVPLESDGYKPATTDFIDGVSYDGHKPLEYIDAFKIGLKHDEPTK